MNSPWQVNKLTSFISLPERCDDKNNFTLKRKKGLPSGETLCFKIQSYNKAGIVQKKLSWIISIRHIFTSSIHLEIRIIKCCLLMQFYFPFPGGIHHIIQIIFRVPIKFFLCIGIICINSYDISRTSGSYGII